MAQVDRIYGLVGTLGVKAPCRVATTTNITLSGLQTVNGVALAAEDRVLVWSQTNNVENGIYVVTTTAWQRAPDFDGSRDVVKGTNVWVTEGTLYSSALFYVSAVGTIGTNAITFAQREFVSASDIHAATSKTPPVSADEFGFWDSVSGGLRKLTWANIVSTLEGALTTLSNITGNITFTGVGSWLQGDFSNATVASRTGIRSSTTNGNTFVDVFPNGTGTSAAVDLFNTSNQTDASVLIVGADATTAVIDSNKIGAGVYLPLVLKTGGAERFRIGTSGELGLGGTAYGTAGQALLSGGSGAAPSWGSVTTVLRGYLSGLAMSTAGASTTMTIAAGQATDSTNSVLMNLASSIAKTTSAWAVGTAQGGLDTGAIAANTTYHFFVIQRPDTGVVDVLISLSPSAPTMPANYTKFRRIASWRTNASSQWVSAVQDGDYFRLLASVLDVNTTNPGTAEVTATLTSIPTGINVIALFNGGITSASATGSGIYFSDLVANNEAPSLSAAPLINSAATGTGAGNVNNSYTLMQIRTNTSAQIRYRMISSDANMTVRIATLGWIDTRGRNA